MDFIMCGVTSRKFFYFCHSLDIELRRLGLPRGIWFIVKAHMCRPYVRYGDGGSWRDAQIWLVCGVIHNIQTTISTRCSCASVAMPQGQH